MRSRGLVRRGFPLLLALGAAVTRAPSLQGSVHAAPPVVTVGAAGAKMQITQASLSEAIDALSRAAGFRVTYDGARPTTMLFNAEIDTPTVAQTLFRLIVGQNLNYAMTFDLSGKKVTSLMVLGLKPRTSAAAGPPGATARPQPFTPPRGSRSDVPVLDDDPVEPEAEPEPTPQPTGAPTPAVPARSGPAGQATPLPPPPFTPRTLFGSPFAPRPSPSPSP